MQLDFLLHYSNVLTCACYVPALLYKPAKGCNITGYVSNFHLHNQKNMVWQYYDWSQERVWPCFIGNKKCYIALCMLYDKLSNLKNCYVWHPNNRFVFQRCIYDVLYRFFCYITCYVTRICQEMCYVTCYRAYVTKDRFFPYITSYITSKWLYNLVCNICCWGPDYVLCNMLYRYIAEADISCYIHYYITNHK